jgi:hypothetical protein
MPFMSDKFPRILHFPWSPGATNDDRIAGPDWYNFLKDKDVVFTEKIDGENTCLKKDGVFARSHTVPNHNPWANHLWPIYDTIVSELGDLEIFGENMYAVHSIEYERLYSYFYVFAVREQGIWKSWEETKFVAEYFGFQFVPEYINKDFSRNKWQFNSDKPYQLEVIVKEHAKSSSLGNTCEGVVVRLADAFPDPVDSTLGYNVLKYVRKNHVQTDEHWTRSWKKARLYNHE